MVFSVRAILGIVLTVLVQPSTFAQASEIVPTNHVLYSDAASNSDPFFILSADLDQDGESDLIWCNWDNNRIDVFSVKERRFLDQKTVSGPFSLTLGDIDGDQLTDLLSPFDIRATGENGIHFLKGKGDGTFEEATLLISGIGRGRRCSVADINGDAKLDIVTSVGTKTGVFLNDGPGTFTTAPVILDPAATSPARAMVIRDFNKDGLPDIAHVDYGDGHLDVFFQNAAGAPTMFSLHRSISIGAGLIDIESADLDNDGYEDIAVTAWWNNDTYVYWNRTGSFTSSGRWSKRAPDVHYYGTDLHLADLDGDGQVEIIRTAQRYYTYLNRSQSCLEVFYRIPSSPGSSTYVWRYVNQTSEDTVCRSVATVDIDKNGTLDFVHTGWTHRRSIDTVGPSEPEGSVFFTRNMKGLLPIPAMTTSSPYSEMPVCRISHRTQMQGMERFQLFQSPDMANWTLLSDFDGWGWSGGSPFRVVEGTWETTYEFPTPPASIGSDRYFYQVRKK